MWYEMLPPLAMFGTFLGLPMILCPAWEYFINQNVHLKDTDFFEIRRNWYRDMYLTGRGERATGVDAIPDLPATKN